MENNNITHHTRQSSPLGVWCREGAHHPLHHAVRLLVLLERWALHKVAQYQEQRRAQLHQRCLPRAPPRSSIPQLLQLLENDVGLLQQIAAPRALRDCRQRRQDLGHLNGSHRASTAVDGHGAAGRRCFDGAVASATAATAASAGTTTAAARRMVRKRPARNAHSCLCLDWNVDRPVDGLVLFRRCAAPMQRMVSKRPARNGHSCLCLDRNVDHHDAATGCVDTCILRHQVAATQDAAQRLVGAKQNLGGQSLCVGSVQRLCPEDIQARFANQTLHFVDMLEHCKLFEHVIRHLRLWRAVVPHMRHKVGAGARKVRLRGKYAWQCFTNFGDNLAGEHSAWLVDYGIRRKLIMLAVRALHLCALAWTTQHAKQTRAARNVENRRTLEAWKNIWNHVWLVDWL